jgi:hypothetical protein
VVPFGPLTAGGLVHARIVTADAVAADNQRWAWAPRSVPARVLVLSRDPAVRDDLARVLLAVNPNFQVEAADPASWKPPAASAPIALAVMHDCYVPGIAADSTLLIYPPAARSAALPAGIKVEGSAPLAEMRTEGGGAAGAPTLLGPARVIAIPEWMHPIANATRSGEFAPITAAAAGRTASGSIGVVAFDIRAHLLLDPDRLDALVATVSLLRRLAAPGNLEIVTTGSYVDLPAARSTQVVEPDGAVVKLVADRFGRVKLRVLQAGRYTIESRAGKFEVFANYYDAAESDIAVRRVASSPAATAARAESAPAPKRATPLALALVALAFAALVAESALLLRHAARWGLRHV